MLHCYCKQFLEYSQLADFSVRSIQALTIRLNEFKAFLKSQRIRSVKKITGTSDQFCGRPQRLLNTCKKVPCLDAQTIFPLFDASSAHTKKYCPQATLSKN